MPRILFPRFALILISGFACSCGSGSKELTASEFWAWFQSRSAEFHEVFQYHESEENDAGKKREEVFNLINERLQDVQPAFSAYLGGSKDTPEVREFIVTVFGDASLFSGVDQFVASAPPIEGWSIIGLKPRRQPRPETTIRTGTLDFKLSNSRFVPKEQSDGTIDITVYLTEGIDQGTEKAAGFARTLTIDFLGERLAGTVLGVVSIRDLADAPDDAIPFLDLWRTINAISVDEG